VFIEIDIDTNIQEVIERTSLLFYGEIPFTMAVSINDTLFSMRRQITEVTWAKAFDIKNPRIPSVMFNVEKISVGGPGSQLRGFKTGERDFMMGRLYQRDIKGITYSWPAWHASGGVKKPHRGRTVAIPKEPDTLRSPTGRIRKPNLPSNITNKRKTFMIKRGGSPHLILRRVSDKETEVVYHFKDTVKINKSFRFFEDAEMIFNRVFPSTFSYNFDQAIKRSPFRRMRG